jgi:hypothetical protein
VRFHRVIPSYRSASARPTESGRSAHWVKVKNPKAPAVKREAEEDWGNKRDRADNESAIFFIVIGYMLLGSYALAE